MEGRHDVIADRPIRVLLVDDSEDIRLLFRLILEIDPDLEVCGEAVNGEEAIKVVAATNPDVVVLDVMMPVMDGLTALPLLRKLCPTTPVIVMTAADTPGLRLEALARGACAVIDKSAASDQLRETLVAVYAGARAACRLAV